MIIGILKEPEGENRVAILPEGAKSLADLGVETILVEDQAGMRAFASNATYETAGATISNRADILTTADLIIGIHRPEANELKSVKKGAALLAVFQPLGDAENVKAWRDSGYTIFSMDMVPRTTRAQSMDILSSQATVAGYKAVLMAAGNLPSFFPMLMTAAGTIIPAKVLILGAGVAGLQAIATARKLGAVVEAFDVRAAVKEEVESLGAKFVEVEGATDDKTAGGYAVEQTEEYKKKQAQAIQEHAIKSDVVICTAQIPGRKAPVLITEDTLNNMKPGSVIIDLAASSGGNCALSKNEQIVDVNGVKIFGYSNLPADMPADASKMFTKNVINFAKLIIKDGQLDLNFEDDIVAGTCITHNKEIYNERIKSMIAN